MQRGLQQSAGSDGGGSISAGSAALEPKVEALPTAVLLPPVDPTDPCLWNIGMACDVPRSCFDCLNAQGSRGQCMVDPVGRCVSLSGYNYTSDFRVANKPSGIMDYFPSSNTSYCAATDATCAECKSRLDTTGWHYGSASPGNVSSTYCVGEGGCVCVATCDASAWNSAVLSVCTTRTRTVYTHQKTIYTGVMVAVCALCVFLFFFTSQWSRRRNPFVLGSESEEIHIPHRRRPNPRQLSLPAWNSMRQKLIEEERSIASASASLQVEPVGHEAASERSAADAA